jgi:hypothetical protein
MRILRNLTEGSRVHAVSRKGTLWGVPWYSVCPYTLITRRSWGLSAAPCCAWHELLLKQFVRARYVPKQTRKRSQARKKSQTTAFCGRRVVSRWDLNSVVAAHALTVQPFYRNFQVRYVIMSGCHSPMARRHYVGSLSPDLIYIRYRS